MSPLAAGQQLLLWVMAAATLRSCAMKPCLCQGYHIECRLIMQKQAMADIPATHWRLILRSMDCVRRKSLWN